MLTNHRIKSVGSFLNRSKHCCECHLHICFWSAFSKCGTHLVQNYCIPNSSYKMFYTFSSNIPTASAISCTFTRLSSKTILCTFLIVSCVLVVFGCPSHGSSSSDVRPHLNSTAHFLIVEIEGWISLWINPSRTKNFMTTWYSSLSILMKHVQDVYCKDSFTRTTWVNKLKLVIRANEMCMQAWNTNFCRLECHFWVRPTTFHLTLV